MSIPTVDVSGSGEALREWLEKKDPKPLIITRDGNPVGAVVSLADTDIEAAWLSLDPEFIRIIEKSRASLRKDGGIPAEEMEARFGHRRKAG